MLKPLFRHVRKPKYGGIGVKMGLTRGRGNWWVMQVEAAIKKLGVRARLPFPASQCCWERAHALGTVSVVALMVAGCASAPSSTSVGWSQSTSLFPPSKVQVPASPRVAHGRQIPRGGGVFKVGTPYTVAGKAYVPRHEPEYDRVGPASWYGDAFHGRKTANGEVFNKYALTGAHPTLPMPSYVYVTNLENGRTVLVRINDRGPYSRGRIVDLSHEVARQLDIESRGIAKVRVKFAGRAPISGDDSRERNFLARQPWASRRNFAMR